MMRWTKAPPLFSVIKCTPDIICGRRPKKALILDVYVGDKDMSSLKEQYEALSIIFDFVIVTPTNFPYALSGIIEPQSLATLYRDFQIFSVKNQHWQSCLKQQKIISSSSIGAKFAAETGFDRQVELKKLSFIAKLNAMALTILDTDF
jgi:hypothetical protein